jgi:hypothetical protein
MYVVMFEGKAVHAQKCENLEPVRIVVLQAEKRWI